jgi:hypothetical protein
MYLDTGQIESAVLCEQWSTEYNTFYGETFAQQRPGLHTRLRGSNPMVCAKTVVQWYSGTVILPPPAGIARLKPGAPQFPYPAPRLYPMVCGKQWHSGRVAQFASVPCKPVDSALALSPSGRSAGIVRSPPARRSRRRAASTRATSKSAGKPLSAPLTPGIAGLQPGNCHAGAWRSQEIGPCRRLRSC